MYYYKARFYNPNLGRFMQTDPIGYKDGMNWYAYVGNDPVNKRDPSGLAQCGNLTGLECKAALKAANDARDALSNASASIGAVAAKINNGEKLNANDQSIVDAVKENFGDKFEGAEGLSDLSSKLSSMAGRIGGDGWGVMLNKGSDAVKGRNGETPLAYTTPGNSYAINVTSSFFKPHSMGNARVMSHETAHLVMESTLYERYGRDEIATGISRGEDMRSNADSYACTVHSEVSNCH